MLAYESWFLQTLLLWHSSRRSLIICLTSRARFRSSNCQANWQRTRVAMARKSWVCLYILCPRVWQVKDESQACISKVWRWVTAPLIWRINEGASRSKEDKRTPQCDTPLNVWSALRRALHNFQSIVRCSVDWRFFCYVLDGYGLRLDFLSRLCASVHRSDMALFFRALLHTVRIVLILLYAHECVFVCTSKFYHTCLIRTVLATNILAHFMHAS